MKHLLILFVFCAMSCKNETSNVQSKTLDPKPVLDTIMVSKTDYDLEIYDYDGLEPLINKNDDNIHVVNFWATWCAPCIKELPYFEAINKNYNAHGVEVLLVSLDFPNKYDTALKPYIIEHNLKSKVVALNDTNQNRWISAIAEEWTGALPATIIYKGDKRKFYEKSFTQEELETELQKFMVSN